MIRRDSGIITDLYWPPWTNSYAMAFYDHEKCSQSWYLTTQNLIMKFLFMDRCYSPSLALCFDICNNWYDGNTTRGLPQGSNRVRRIILGWRRESVDPTTMGRLGERYWPRNLGIHQYSLIIIMKTIGFGFSILKTNIVTVGKSCRMPKRH